MKSLILADLERARALLTPPPYPFPDPAILYYHPDDAATIQPGITQARAAGHRILGYANGFMVPGQVIVSDVSYMAATLGMDVERYWADAVRAHAEYAPDEVST